MTETHFEEFLWLADVTPDAVLLAWGGFWFRRADPAGPWRVVGDSALQALDSGRSHSVGALSEPYGDAVVTVHDEDGAVVAEARTNEVNHAWVRGLRPDTAYRYRITVDGRQWAAGERWDWCPAPGGGRDLAPRGRAYTTVFRTHPAPEVAAALDFAVLGDAGVGIRTDDEASKRQERIAEVLERLVTDHDVRLVLTTGDNVYAGGADDDDWYPCYFQPYRYTIARVPVFPTVGNHDSRETETSDNRDTLNSNYHVGQRFTSPPTGRRASTEHGLYYRFGYGAEIEFVCVDTSEGLDGPHPHFYEHPDIQEFLREAFSTTGSPPRCRITFCHHPPYCAGPDHDNDAGLLEWVVPLMRGGGAQVMFSGHEHNFQLTRADGITYFVTGAGGKLEEEPPTRFAQARTVAWAAVPHLLQVQVDGSRMVVTPLTGPDQDGAPQRVIAWTPEGESVEEPFAVHASR